jgi:hypothetical protein
MLQDHLIIGVMEKRLNAVICLAEHHQLGVKAQAEVVLRCRTGL